MKRLLFAVMCVLGLSSTAFATALTVGQLEAEINAEINTNGHQAITGSVLNGVLIDMTNTLSVLNVPGTPPTCAGTNSALTWSGSAYGCNTKVVNTVGSTVTGDIAVFNGTSGSSIQDGGAISALTSYLAPGTGGQTRTQSAINGDFVDVFNYLTAAQITDVTNGACTLNVATSVNNALTAMGKGKLFFPKGTYCVSAPITVSTGQNLVGSGVYVTTIQALAGASTVLLQTANFGSLVGTNTAGGPCSFGVRDIGFNGNKANVTGTAQTNIQLYGYDFTFDNVSTYNGPAAGIFTQWSTSPSVPVVAGCDGMEAHVHHLKSFANNGAGWTDQGPHDTVLEDVLIFINGADGFDCLSSTTYECGISSATNFHAYSNHNGELYVSGVASVGAWFVGSNIIVESDITGAGLTSGAYGQFLVSNVWDFANAGTGINISASSGNIVTACRTSGNGSGNNFGSGNTVTACN